MKARGARRLGTGDNAGKNSALILQRSRPVAPNSQLLPPTPHKTMNTTQLLKLTAFGAVMFVGGCATNAPDATAEKKETVVITSPAKAPAHGHGGAAHNATVHTHTTRLRVTSAPAVVEAGKPVKLTLQIVDNADSTPINEFETVHDKKLHMILTSSDLSWFSHVHPEFKGDGKFEVTATFPAGGKYRLYADYKPKGEEGEVALSEVVVKGSPTLPAKPTLVADKIVDTWIVKNTKSALEGQPPAADATAYQVALMPMPEKIVAGEDVMLHFQVRNANGKRLESLQPYLGAMGHSVILDADANTYLHTHPMESKVSGGDSHASGGSDVMFHSNFPKAGLY